MRFIQNTLAVLLTVLMIVAPIQAAPLDHENIAVTVAAVISCEPAIESRHHNEEPQAGTWPRDEYARPCVQTSTHKADYG